MVWKKEKIAHFGAAEVPRKRGCVIYDTKLNLTFYTVYSVRNYRFNKLISRCTVMYSTSNNLIIIIYILSCPNPTQTSVCLLLLVLQSLSYIPRVVFSSLASIIPTQKQTSLVNVIPIGLLSKNG